MALRTQVHAPGVCRSASKCANERYESNRYQRAREKEKEKEREKEERKKKREWEI